MHVNDVILTGSNMIVLSQLLEVLCQDFSFKSLRDLHYFLGIQCHRTSQGLVLFQHKYITDLLRKTHMIDCKPVSSPMSTTSKLSAFDLNSIDDPTLYRSTEGSLQYLLMTRPDLAFSVNKVC